MLMHADDRLLWIIVGSGLLIAAKAIPYYLRYIRTITEVSHDEIPSKGRCEDAEDALKLSTLEKLAAGPSYKLRASALRIIADRSIKDTTRRLLLRDLASKDSSRREQALHALWFLLSESSLKTIPEIGQGITLDTSAFAAIVECLVNLLPLHENGPPVRADNPTASSPLLPHNRPASETLALLILRKLLTSQSVTSALSAGLVSRWLNRYPFPCALPQNGGYRQDVVPLFKKWGQDDPLMASIMAGITQHSEGLKQLYQHGLIGSLSGEAEVDIGGIDDVFMANSENTAGIPPVSSGGPSPPVSAWSRRPPDLSSNQAERAVRQRRREAAVYSEGNEPLTQDNIFQRQLSNLMLEPGSGSGAPETNPEIEAGLARMNEGVEREEDELAEAREEVRDIDSRRESAVQTNESLRAFWQWLIGQARSRHRSTLTDLDNHHHR